MAHAILNKICNCSLESTLVDIADAGCQFFARFPYNCILFLHIHVEKIHNNLAHNSNDIFLFLFSNLVPKNKTILGLYSISGLRYGVNVMK